MQQRTTATPSASSPDAIPNVTLKKVTDESNTGGTGASALPLATVHNGRKTLSACSPSSSSSSSAVHRSGGSHAYVALPFYSISPTKTTTSGGNMANSKNIRTNMDGGSGTHAEAESRMQLDGLKAVASPSPWAEDIYSFCSTSRNTQPARGRPDAISTGVGARDSSGITNSISNAPRRYSASASAVSASAGTGVAGWTTTMNSPVVVSIGDNNNDSREGNEKKPQGGDSSGDSGISHGYVSGKNGASAAAAAAVAIVGSGEGRGRGARGSAGVESVHVAMRGPPVSPTILPSTAAAAAKVSSFPSHSSYVSAGTPKAEASHEDTWGGDESRDNNTASSGSATAVATAVAAVITGKNHEGGDGDGEGGSTVLDAQDRVYMKEIGVAELLNELHRDLLAERPRNPVSFSRVWLKGRRWRKYQ